MWLFFVAISIATLCVSGVLLAQETEQGDPVYVGSETCVDCHAKETEAWQGSHHALAWTEPSSGSIVADFDGTVFEHKGVTYNFRKDLESYFVLITESDGSHVEYPVHSVAGIEPLQQYLLETEPGRLQSFDVVWDVEQKRWYHLYPDQDLPPDDGLHWTGPYKNWNGRCAECHATGYEKNYDAGTRTFASAQAEIGVGCEACHGPASEHLAWARDVVNGKATETKAGYGFLFDLPSAGAEATIQQCAGCHSRREPQFAENPVPGTPYHDAYSLSLLVPGTYHADGQILDEVYVYGSFLQSKMYQKGVSCTNCHNAHTADLIAEGNGLCTQCHSSTGNPAFPSLKLADFDSSEHHFHDPGTEGAQCKSCHMIERVYMGIDGRRDHSFRIPRPDLAAMTGAPDACTDCHQDKTAAWAAEEIAVRYPESGKREPHYGTDLALGRANPVASRDRLIQLAQDKNTPGLARATSLWLLQQAGDAEAADRVAAMLQDPDPLVRAAAVGVQSSAPPQTMVPRIVPILSDPVRLVRTAAARQLLGAPVTRMPENISEDLRVAMSEWQSSLSARLDFPETYLVYGGIALTMRDFQAASDAFREVVRMDPQMQDAWVMLVRIAAATGGAETATPILEEALAALPESAVLRDLEAQLAQGK